MGNENMVSAEKRQIDNEADLCDTNQTAVLDGPTNIFSETIAQGESEIVHNETAAEDSALPETLVVNHELLQQTISSESHALVTESIEETTSSDNAHGQELRHEDETNGGDSSLKQISDDVMEPSAGSTTVHKTQPLPNLSFAGSKHEGHIEEGQSRQNEYSQLEKRESIEPGIATVERNLIQLINEGDGRLPVSNWATAYKEKFGAHIFKRHMADVGSDKLKHLMPRLKAVEKDEGPKGGPFLYHRLRNVDEFSKAMDPIIELEKKLVRLIQDHKGKVRTNKFRRVFDGVYGSGTLESLLNECRAESMESATKGMSRISTIRVNKKNWFVITDPSQAINLAPVSTKQPKFAQNGTVGTAISLPLQATPPFLLVDTHEKLRHWNHRFLQHFEQKIEKKCVSVSCQGDSNGLYLLSLAFSTSDIVLFDCVKLEATTICEKLETLFESPDFTKILHDLHQDIALLCQFGCLSIFHGMMDTQLIVEHMDGNLHCDFYGMLNLLQLPMPLSTRLKNKFAPKVTSYAKRPISEDLLSHVVDAVTILVQSHDKILKTIDSVTLRALGEASDMRAASSVRAGIHSSRRVGFDVSRQYRMASYELLSVLDPENMMREQPLEVVQDTSMLLGILPCDVQDALSNLDMTHLSDIVLDKGRRPHAWINGRREMLLLPDRLVEGKEIEDIADKFRFGSDNRAGLERQLHRISAIRNRESAVIGMTVRVGRHVSGNAGIIADLLFQAAESSILFLGEPGSGKTTIVREVTRILAEKTNVCIVDTSNEIAGDGDIPHPCVGLARRLMVPTLDKQSTVMIEAVQNHTPSCMVIDEIGRKTEVEAAQTCKNRGVRLIASAHGDLRKLVKNPKIRGVIGGIESVTLGDAEAKLEGKKHGEGLSKVKTQRAGAPIFEIIIELERGSYDSWRIVMDSAKAVDDILDRQHYETQRRTREADTGAIHLSFENA